MAQKIAGTIAAWLAVSLVIFIVPLFLSWGVIEPSWLWFRLSLLLGAVAIASPRIGSKDD